MKILFFIFLFSSVSLLGVLEFLLVCVVSFDCSKVGLVNEKIICWDVELFVLDD